MGGGVERGCGQLFRSRSQSISVRLCLEALAQSWRKEGLSRLPIWGPFLASPGFGSGSRDTIGVSRSQSTHLHWYRMPLMTVYRSSDLQWSRIHEEAVLPARLFFFLKILGLS